MASYVILDENTPAAPVEVTGSGTLYPTGTFAGAHIRLEASPEENGDFQPFEYLHDSAPKNLSIPGGGWVRAAVGNSQDLTNLSLTLNV